MVHAIVTLEVMRIVDDTLLPSTTEVYEIDRIDFANAYLATSAEHSGVGITASHSWNQGFADRSWLIGWTKAG